jgi:hypothetical protein
MRTEVILGEPKGKRQQKIPIKGRIILKQILRTWDIRVCIELI